MIVIGHNCIGTDIDIEQVGKKMHAIENPLPTVAETLPGKVSSPHKNARRTQREMQ